MNKKYLNIALAFVGVIAIVFVVVIITKKKATPSKEQTVNQVMNDYSAISKNFSKADLQIMFDSWGASGYEGEFIDFIKG